MRLSWIDVAIVGAIVLLTLGIGVWVSRRSGRSASFFFLSGRNLPWWMLGTSMVATTFATDTPNLVTNVVRTNGVAGNWVWWSFLLTGLLTTFVYARLWRRSGVLTDLEFYEIRYSGRAAGYLRCFRALYLGVFFNIMVMASVTLAAIKISAVMLGLTPLQTVVIAGAVTVVFSAAGGFLGVLLTDMLLFVLSMTGATVAAYVAVNHPQVGGLDQLLLHPQVSTKLAMLPDFSNTEMALAVFIVPLAVQWWSVWYPGSEPGGGGYVAQRMLAARNESHAMGAVLLFQLAHYALRPWPWILVGLASLVVFPDLDALRAAFPELREGVVGHDLAYPAMLTFLPTGLLGLVLASLVAAYMSTMSTQLNWGASYVVNDFYQRFVKPHASETELVLAGRVTTVLLMLAACTMALFLENAMQAFSILLTVGAGTGLLFILRWFWSRINVWSEVSAMLISFIVALYFNFAALPGWSEWQRLVVGVLLTSLGWLAVTLLTPATDSVTMAAFRQRLLSPGDSLAASRGTISQVVNLPVALVCMLVGAIGVYSVLFAIGYLLYGNPVVAVLLLSIAGGAGAIIFRSWHSLTLAGAR